MSIKYKAEKKMSFTDFILRLRFSLIYFNNFFFLIYKYNHTKKKTGKITAYTKTSTSVHFCFSLLFLNRFLFDRF